MNSLRDHIRSAAEAVSIPLTAMAAEEERAYLRAFFARFTLPQVPCWPIWSQTIPQKCSFRVDAAYLHIHRLLLRHAGGEPLVLVHEDSQGVGCLLVRDPHDFLGLLEECHAFVYYLSSMDLRFMVCENDHDYLIGVAEAAGWVAGYAQASFSAAQLASMDFYPPPPQR